MNAKLSLGISAAILAAVIANSLFYNVSPKTANDNVGLPSASLRIGYFPNVNHAQAVLGFENGDFQKQLLKAGITVKPLVFSAGPSVIEALFANQIDIAYVGPNPAINGYIVSDGNDPRIISGAASGGAVFIIRNDSGIGSSKDLSGKKFASPQLGNTQDISLRSFLLRNGHNTRENGGDVEVTSATLQDILTLFLRKQIDGAWVPEPWGAMLEKEANGKIFIDERNLWPDGKFVTANIIARTDYLKNNPETLKKFLSLHVDETMWINNHKDQAVLKFNTALKKLTGKVIQTDILREAFSRIEFTYDPIKESLFKFARDEFELGILSSKGNSPPPGLSGIYDLRILDSVLTEKGLPQIN
jgi:NitT/TauT family transport system substrate-binding protein